MAVRMPEGFRLMHPIHQTIPMHTPVPPPWSLRGDGDVFFYRFAPGDPGVDDDHSSGYRGGLGAIAWMDYRESPVGPYREILFIPGRVAYGGRRLHTITRIFVESWESVVSGRANWGIPKYRADFMTARDGETETLTAARPAADGGAPFARLVVEPGALRLPIDTRLCPVTLIEQADGQTFLTALTVRAGVSRLRVREVWADDAWFPQPRRALLGAVRLRDFRITFPVPNIEGRAVDA